MKRKIKKYLIAGLGVLLILIGIPGLVLPFLQGFLFIALGLFLLSMDSPRIRTWLEVYTRKFPKIHSFIQKIEARIVRFIES